MEPPVFNPLQSIGNVLSEIVLACAAIVLAGCFAILRIGGHTSQSFQAAAHVFVGAVIATAVIKRSWKPYGIIAVAICVVEVACAVAARIS